MREGGLRDVGDVSDAPVELEAGLGDVGPIEGGAEGAVGDFRSPAEGSAEDCCTGSSVGVEDLDRRPRVGGGIRGFHGGCLRNTGESDRDVGVPVGVGDSGSRAADGVGISRNDLGAGVEDSCGIIGGPFDFLELFSSSSDEETNFQCVITLIEHSARVYVQEKRRKGRRRSIRYLRSNARSSLNFGAVVTEEEFRGAFRMFRSTFARLVSVLRPHIGRKLPDTNIVGREAAGYAIVGLRERIAICLRLLAGASYHDIAMIFRVSHSTIYEVFHRFLDVVASNSIQELQIKFPFDDDAKLEQLAEGFMKSTSNHPALYGCVGALDGYAVRIRRPFVSEESKPNDYMSRKGFFAINVQAICDAKCRFLYIYADTPGSTHDATAYALSSFCKKWESQRGTNRWWIAGDEAYSITENLLTPWPGRNLDPFKDSFNFHFSGGNRNVIERAFGLMTERWGIFWKKLHVSLKRASQIVLACAALQNFLIDNREENFPDGGCSTSVQHVFFQDDCALEERPGMRRDRERCRRRLEMTQALRSAGQLRPAVARRTNG